MQLKSVFAVLDREITYADCAALGLKKYASDRRNPNIAADNEDVVGTMSWYDAVELCRALTSAIGGTEEDQAYPSPKHLDADAYPRDATPGAGGAPRDWPVRAERAGFRLPTEAEWEVACRAGTRSSYGFGSDPELVARYGWVQREGSGRVQPSKQLRPNPRGLFDMHGNVWEHCHDWYTLGDLPPSVRDKPARYYTRVFRGGSCIDTPAASRSAFRNSAPPSTRGIVLGLRPVLTITN